MCSQQGKLFGSNLSAVFFVEHFTKEMNELIPYVDILFGSSIEYRSFATVRGWGNNLSLEEIVVRVANMPKSNKARPRIVVLTQGPLHTIVSCQWIKGGAAVKFPVPPLVQEEIVDTNAAGESFVGGFMYGIIKQINDYESANNSSRISNSVAPPIELNIPFCIDAAHMAARHILLHEGCSFQFSAAEIEALDRDRRN